MFNRKSGTATPAALSLPILASITYPPTFLPSSKFVHYYKLLLLVCVCVCVCVDDPHFASCSRPQSAADPALMHSVSELVSLLLNCKVMNIFPG